MTAFVPALLIKLTIILSLGLVVTAMLRSLSPSFRHLVLYATLASCVALPFAMLMSPQWNVPVLPRATVVSPTGNANTTPSNSALSAKVIDAGAPRAPSIDVDAPPTTRGVLGGFGALPLLPLVWLVGFLAVIAWLAVGRIGLRRIVRSAWPLNGSDWREILDEERAYAGVTKPVLICSSSVVSTPLTWRSGAPVVLLPEDALDWPETHRRIVLRHELAHVARGDSLTQLFAGFVCAIYWFHPLVWITERRLRAECERACDDSVVSLGTPAAEYAAHLLEVARSARAFGAAGFLSVAMARPSQLEGRLLAVLNESRRRVSLSRGARPVAALLSALVLIPLAAFRAVPKSDAPAKPRIVSTLPNAATPGVNQGTSNVPAAIPSAPPTTSTASAGSTTRALSTSTSTGQAISMSSGYAMSTSTAEGTSIATWATGKRPQPDTTFQLSVPAKPAGTLVLDLKTGGNIAITGWDNPQILVQAELRGRNWRETRVRLEPSDGGARLTSDFTVSGNNQSTSHAFRINVPRTYNVRIASSGGSVAISNVNGRFTGHTGGGEITIEKSNGEANITTGGGDVYVYSSRLDGKVSTGGGIVRIESVSGDLRGSSGSGPVSYANSEGSITVNSGSGSGSGSGSSVSIGKGSGSRSTITNGSGIATTTTYADDEGGYSSSFGTRGVRMNSAGGDISLRAAPDGARVTTGGGAVRIGPSNGEVYASTGGGNIYIGPATGSVEAHTGAGKVSIELRGAEDHSVDVTSGLGDVTLTVPRDLNATLELETGYTNNLGHKTRIISDFPVQTTETTNWEADRGTPRRYVRARQVVGKGGAVIRVRTTNGDIVINRVP